MLFAACGDVPSSLQMLGNEQVDAPEDFMRRMNGIIHAHFATQAILVRRIPHGNMRVGKERESAL